MSRRRRASDATSSASEKGASAINLSGCSESAANDESAGLRGRTVNGTNDDVLEDGFGSRASRPLFGATTLAALLVLVGLMLLERRWWSLLLAALLLDFSSRALASGIEVGHSGLGSQMLLLHQRKRHQWFGQWQLRWTGHGAAAPLVASAAGVRLQSSQLQPMGQQALAHGCG